MCVRSSAGNAFANPTARPIRTKPIRWRHPYYGNGANGSRKRARLAPIPPRRKSSGWRHSCAARWTTRPPSTMPSGQHAAWCSRTRRIIRRRPPGVARGFRHGYGSVTGQNAGRRYGQRSARRRGADINAIAQVLDAWEAASHLTGSSLKQTGASAGVLRRTPRLDSGNLSGATVNVDRGSGLPPHSQPPSATGSIVPRLLELDAESHEHVPESAIPFNNRKIQNSRSAGVIAEGKRMRWTKADVERLWGQPRATAICMPPDDCVVHGRPSCRDLRLDGGQRAHRCRLRDAVFRHHG